MGCRSSGTADVWSISEDRTATDIVRNVSTYDETGANDTLAIVLSPAEPYGEDAAPSSDSSNAAGRC